MRPNDIATSVTIVAISAAGGWLLGGTIALVVGIVAGALAAAVTVKAGVRPMVAIVVVTGTVGGALAGDGVVRALCMPGSCPGVAATASVLTGAAALVGVGLVMALVIRSFDEYQEGAGRRASAPLPDPRPRSGDDA